jgi:hypothetical protein
MPFLRTIRGRTAWLQNGAAASIVTMLWLMSAAELVVCVVAFCLQHTTGTHHATISHVYAGDHVLYGRQPQSWVLTRTRAAGHEWGSIVFFDIVSCTLACH